MHRSTLSPRRTVHHLAAVMALGALGGCADPSGPARSVSPNAIIIIGGHPVVLNAQLRAIGNPNEKPVNAVVGHIQLRITESDETGLVVSWQVHFANPECEASTFSVGGAVMIQDSEDIPSPEDVVFRLVGPGTALGCGNSFLEGSTAISEELAAQLVEDPGDFIAVFFLEGGRMIGGTLQLGGPDTSPTP
jgi:hypothetical protein